MKNIFKKKPIYFLLALLLSASIYLIYTNYLSRNQNRETSTPNNKETEQEDHVDENTEIYQKYSEYVLGAYNPEAPKDKYIVAMLEDVSDVVKKIRQK